MPIKSSLPFTKKKLLRELFVRENWWPSPDRLNQFISHVHWSHHKLLKVHRYRHQNSTKKQYYCLQDTWSLSLPQHLIKVLRRCHVLHTTSILLERLLLLISFSTEKANSTKMSGKINKELTMNPDKTEVTLLMKENASQGCVRCCLSPVGASIRSSNSTKQSTQDSARLILRLDVQDLQGLQSLAKASHFLLQRKA